MSQHHSPLFRYDRHPDEERGRCLIASTDLRKDRLIFVERPVIAMQSTGNMHEGALVCSYCMAFCGSPGQNLKVISDPSFLEEMATSNNNQRCVNEKDDDDVNNYALNGPHALYCCRHNCGHIYCSLECQQDDWKWGGHRELCTGMIPDPDECTSRQYQQKELGANTLTAVADEKEQDDLSNTSPSSNVDSFIDPLLEFKVYARNTNEIFLLVATWLVRIIKHNLPYHEDDDLNTHPYTDFQMNTWWDVKANEEAILKKEKEDPEEKKANKSNVEGGSLEDILKQLCEDSHSYLSRTLKNRLEQSQDSPWLTPIGMARLIGSLEQNCLGIRRKHALQRNLMQDTNLRQEFHTELIQCLEGAGMIEDNNDKCDDNTCPCDVDGCGNDRELEKGPREGLGSKYSPDDIATFLASLTQDFTNGCVFDEWDEIIRPLDGISHYSIATKMNHSCNPNVILVYKTRGWGRDHPLVAYIVALKDIKEGEELTISYIDSEDPYEERQTALANYGFICTCSKCISEKDEIGQRKNEEDDDANSLNDDLFGDDSEDIDDDDLFGNNDDGDEQANGVAENTDSAENEDGNDYNEEPRGAQSLLDVLKQLDTISNKSNHAAIPVEYLAPASNYVVKQASSLISDFQNAEGFKGDGQKIENLLKKIKAAIRERDFSACRLVGSGLELYLYSLLESNGSWTTPMYRASYWCSAITASIGYAHEGSFLLSIKYLDKAIILGQDRSLIEDYFGYVELHASQMAAAPCPIAVDCKVPDYRCPKLKELVASRTLPKPIQIPVKELISDEKSNKASIMASYNQSQTCVIRHLASEWAAVEKWRYLDRLAWEFGHRLVPIEIGSMTTRMKEAVVTFRSFVANYMSSSASRDFWSFEDATDGKSQIAYLAQHPFLDQVSDLCKDIDMNPYGVQPTNINIWMGTGGTRTPLHFDSYDNLLIQLVGAKYVRLYEKENSDRLYVRQDKSYGSQGNMSELDCEQEDFEKHPLAKDCNYKEVLLFPGDCLFIPSRQWHYVRSLSTSVSVNYWF
ncbi:unnamed protein product [Pseudo-nitzschia multistriata]|uniref:JmjC domain-containing protein n=1 Tax=Pseudo-nitzschia multistriata TaxID=183589 RepID=A0A448ZL93_9STRA|nr:unnamed protein product [Pseudo-nitzschia multistriata]